MSGKAASGCLRERCSLCLERLRGSHSHPASWNEDMREVLVRFSNEGDISKLCVCKADELSIRRGVRGSSEFTPRWLKHEQKKKQLLCIVPGCGSHSERSCGFTTYENICIACGVCDENQEVSCDQRSSFLLCGQHYRAVHRYCNPEEDVQCDLCGTKRRHRANVNSRPILRPECIEAILREVGSFDGSLKQGTVCAACYVFCQSALRQHEDTRSDEVIISELRSCVEQLKGKLMHSSNEEVVDEVALLKTCLYLWGIMLNDQAITFPCLYQHYCKASVTPVPSCSCVCWQRIW